MLVKYMSDYFEEKKNINENKDNYLNENLLKIVPDENYNSIDIIKKKSSGWKRLDDIKSIERVYSFKTNKQREAFIVEMLKLTRRVDCLLCVKFSNQKEVKVCLTSYSPEVSEIEIETSVEVDKIRKDVVYYYASES